MYRSFELKMLANGPLHLKHSFVVKIWATHKGVRFYFLNRNLVFEKLEVGLGRGSWRKNNVFFFFYLFITDSSDRFRSLL